MKITAVRAALGTGLLLLKPKSVETQMSTKAFGQQVGTVPTSSFFPISAIQLVPWSLLLCPSPLPLSISSSLLAPPQPSPPPGRSPAVEPVTAAGSGSHPASSSGRARTT